MSGSSTKKSDNGSASKGQVTSSQQGKSAAKEVLAADTTAKKEKSTTTTEEAQTAVTQEGQASTTQEGESSTMAQQGETATTTTTTTTTTTNIRPWNLIHSEPDIFTDMIKRYGVQGVVVQDVLMLSLLPELQPATTYSIILAYKYKESQLQETAEDEDAANIMFSNQAVVNSCATQSLVNTLTNVDIERGQLIQNFMDTTKHMSSEDRGLALGDITQFREIHNSYGVPVPAQENVEEEKVKEQDTENTYHFVTYLPKDGFLWELDSLRLQPTKIMVINNGENWITLLEPFLTNKIESDGLEANLLAVVKGRLPEKEEQLAIMVAHDNDLENKVYKEMIDPHEPSTSTSPIRGSNLTSLGRQTLKQQEVLKKRIKTLQDEIADMKEAEANAATRVEGLKKATLEAIAEMEAASGTMEGKAKSIGPKTKKTITKAKEGEQAIQRGRGRGRGTRGRGRGQTPKAETSSTGKKGKTSKKRSFDDVEAEAARKEAVNKRYNLRRK